MGLNATLTLGSFAPTVLFGTIDTEFMLDQVLLISADIKYGRACIVVKKPR